MKQFLFMYPIPEYFDSLLDINNVYSESGFEMFKKSYRDILNKSIDLRYRQNGFKINYAKFDGHQVSDMILLSQTDKIIEVGMDFKTFLNSNLSKSCNEYIYPDNDHILNQLGDISSLKLGGFHRSDCVSKVAKRAYEKGIDVLVDEDLTELLAIRRKDPDFDPKEFKGLGMKKGTWCYQEYVDSRKGKPWLLQPQ